MSVVKRNTQWYQYPEVSSMTSSSIYDIVPEAAPKGKYARFSRPQGFKPSGSCRRLLRMAKYTSPKWRLAVFSLDAVRPGGRLLGSRRFRIDNDRSELCFAGLPQPVGASGDQGEG